jgi:hypothetical protein
MLFQRSLLLPRNDSNVLSELDGVPIEPIDPTAPVITAAKLEPAEPGDLAFQRTVFFKQGGKAETLNQRYRRWARFFS